MKMKNFTSTCQMAHANKIPNSRGGFSRHSSFCTERKNLSTGFTLIEMIVSISLFTMVVFITIGALLSIVDANKKVNSLRTTMDNLNFAMESMSRNIRTGTNYSCNGSGDCPSGGTEFSFTDQNGDTTIYKYKNSTKRIQVKNGSGGFKDITSGGITVNDLKFYVVGTGSGDGAQPRVLITVQGSAGVKEKTTTTFNLQTTVSQRNLDS